ncbi:fagellar hook-basal body protein [Thermocrinis albus DSM 14484]|uniref:Flagellar hook protein FlgE n=1 Tax=Thermocrinis albus (strain DSM 14484 / JCM 11386 / HI 11/12) TaxID=638303 RepID=D3SP96_THEAH|nr:flagellar hook protein FlgE [Thermocrinis albus]ADC88983.1 fagellar hook-basal body protein [Thermocrinis albus DSM 14484]
MLRSFFNAVTGLNAYRTWMDITSDNLANVNTIGFKASRPIFQDVISSVTVGLNTVTNTIKTTTYGAGVLIDSTQKIWTIGNFKQTGINTDLAIQGRGLFILKDPISGAHYYTRDGEFRLSRDGFMVNSAGLKLQGFRVDENGRTVGTGLEDIKVVPQLEPKPTGVINFLQPSNLNATATEPPNPFNPLDPSSYNYRYTLTIYDSLGTPYQADMYFRKTNLPNQWEIHLRADIDPNSPGYELSGDWTVTFDSYGKLIYDNATVLREPQGSNFAYYLNPANLSVPASTPSGGTFPSASVWRIYVGTSLQSGAPNPGQPIPTSFVTQHASDFVVTASQNGYARGDLVDVYVLSEDGAVVGVYSNGKSLPLYRVAVAVFSDPEELIKKGANLYTSISTPTVMVPGGAEKVRSGMLEMSNVDIATEFVNLISAQRAYQANAKTITATNAVLDETVNLVR